MSIAPLLIALGSRRPPALNSPSLKTPILSSHGLFPSQSSPSSIMTLQITSADASSSSSSFGCIDNFPKPPTSVQTKPSKSTFVNSTNNLIPTSSSYPPMPRSDIDHQYIPIDPLYLPRRRPNPPYRLGEDISGAGAGIRYIGIAERQPTLSYIALRQDRTLSHYSRPYSSDDFIDPDSRNIRTRCMRVGRAAWLLWMEIVLLLKACAPQRRRRWWRQCGDFIEVPGLPKNNQTWKEMPMRRTPWNDTCDVFPLFLIDLFHDSFLLWLNRRFITHSSNFGAMTQLIRHPLSPYILPFTWWVKRLLLLFLLFCHLTHIPVYRFILFPWLCKCTYWGCASWLSFWLTLFFMLVEFSGNDVVIASSA